MYVTCDACLIYTKNDPRFFSGSPLCLSRIVGDGVASGLERNMSELPRYITPKSSEKKQKQTKIQYLLKVAAKACEKQWLKDDSFPFGAKDLFSGSMSVFVCG